ncbi:hypothetical protein K8Z61_11225 [Nocardioides sp. TRM66260-LWL]|uniref:hypothetical protein n=1 Tax=Nocardioides sp. TRM66260-LWL TaxID=2874478 RepID=UPI001CC40A90|nr:hypothetical protein [Nocardioides sp. TRM66260-LWL]MBZ5735070.1 hypothetical protein [Nocardioides sp. TRM66260-LWL]
MIGLVVAASDVTRDVTSAHSIGGAKDLPIPAGLAIAGAVAALAVSFVVLAIAWRTPRFEPGTDGRALPWLTALVDSTAFRLGARVVGLLVVGWAVFAAVFGQDVLNNPFFGMFYVWLWVGLVPASLLLGPVWKAISPARSVHWLVSRATGGDPGRGLYEYPERLGLWPAALGLYAFVWLELVYPYSTELGPVRLWVAVYAAVMLLGGALFGEVFFERADPFEVYSSMVARLSVFGRRSAEVTGTAARGGRPRPPADAGQIVVLSPLSNLSSLPARPGLIAVVSVLFGSTAFDSFRDSTHWVRFIQDTPVIRDRVWANQLANNAGLLAFVLLVALVLVVGTASTGVEAGTRRRGLPVQFAHSVVPIIVGYVVAHYLSYFVEVGQDTVIKASDPLTNGSNLLGTGDLTVSYWLSYHPTFLANTKVLAVVIGHVLGVVAAHDRAIRLLPARHHVTGQLPLLVAMVGFTAGGLYLLFSA